MIKCVCGHPCHCKVKVNTLTLLLVLVMAAIAQIVYILKLMWRTLWVGLKNSGRSL
jgi:hypothetical protein